MKAIFQAYNFATKYIGIKVEILLETGVHFIRPTSIEDYFASIQEQTHVDFSNPQFNLVIKPIDCNETTLKIVDRITDSVTQLNYIT